MSVLDLNILVYPSPEGCEGIPDITIVDLYLSSDWNWPSIAVSVCRGITVVGYCIKIQTVSTINRISSTLKNVLC